ncbi:hypothetical protein J6590_044177 [Homalodisca vitripennis]|nr:hypothetical protein J6590_044177 [Homalodisca vitripennis]
MKIFIWNGKWKPSPVGESGGKAGDKNCGPNILVRYKVLLAKEGPCIRSTLSCRLPPPTHTYTLHEQALHLQSAAAFTDQAILSPVKNKLGYYIDISPHHRNYPPLLPEARLPHKGVVWFVFHFPRCKFSQGTRRSHTEQSDFVIKVGYQDSSKYTLSALRSAAALYVEPYPDLHLQSANLTYCSSSSDLLVCDRLRQWFLILLNVGRGLGHKF